jgi:hypothetical protein
VNEGVNIPPRGQISPLGARGEVKNGPQGDQMSLLQKSPKMYPNPFFVKMNPQLLCAFKKIKVAQKVGLLLHLKKLLKVHNRPIVENSPNLVTQLLTHLGTKF